MFKKLAVIVICLDCLNLFADQSPFGIEIGKTNVKDIQQDNINKPSTIKPENIPGYIETYLNPEKFSLNDNQPVFVKTFSSNEGNVEAIVVEYKSDNTTDLIADLDKKYPKTFSRKTFYGSYEVEYRNDNCLIRVVKPFGGRTLLLYGTIKWFNTYDEYYKQGTEVRKKRREFVGESSTSISSRNLVPHGETFDERFNYLRSHFFKNFWNIDGFDEFFETAERISEKDKNTNVKSYRSEKRYSKIGDIEEWFYDDNGRITKIKKTPEGTTVTHGDEAKNVVKVEESNEEQLLYGRQIKDAGL